MLASSPNGVLVALALFGFFIGIPVVFGLLQQYASKFMEEGRRPPSSHRSKRSGGAP